MDLTTVEKNLRERGFKVSAFATAQEAADYLNAQIDRSSVSFGGSVTLSQMGLFESLGAHNTIYSHWNVPDGMNADEVREKAATCEHYLLSANGLAEKPVRRPVDAEIGGKGRGETAGRGHCGCPSRYGGRAS